MLYPGKLECVWGSSGKIYINGKAGSQEELLFLKLYYFGVHFVGY